MHIFIICSAVHALPGVAQTYNRYVCDPHDHLDGVFMKFYFSAPLNTHKLCNQKILVIRPVLPQFLADFAQTSCAHGPLHADSESFCLERPVLNVEDAVEIFLKYRDTTSRASHHSSN